MFLEYDVYLPFLMNFSGPEVEIVRQSLQKTSSNRLPYGTFPFIIKSSVQTLRIIWLYMEDCSFYLSDSKSI